MLLAAFFLHLTIMSLMQLRIMKLFNLCGYGRRSSQAFLAKVKKAPQPLDLYRLTGVFTLKRRQAYLPCDTKSIGNHAIQLAKKGFAKSHFYMAAATKRGVEPFNFACVGCTKG